MFRNRINRTHSATAAASSAPAEQTGTGRRRARRAAAGLILAAGAAGLLAAGTGVASASTAFTAHLTPDNTAFLQLDVSGASTAPGAPVIDWWTNGGANQTWTFTPVGNGNYEIVNQNSGQCLTTDEVAGDQLFQYYCQSAPNQLWKTGLTNDPQDFFIGKSIYNQASGLDVDVYGNSPWPGAAIDAWYPNGGYNQSFSVD